MLPVLEWASPLRIVPYNIDIIAQQRGRTLMQMVPDSVSYEASPYPAIGQTQGAHDGEDLPSNWVCSNDVPDLASVIHSETLLVPAR